MHILNIANVYIGILAAAAYAHPAVDSKPAVSMPVTQFPTIVVAEFEHVGSVDCSDRSSRICKLPVRARIDQVLKNAAALELVGRPFAAELPIFVGDTNGDEGTIWTNRHDIQQGQRYVLIALNPSSLADVIAKPVYLEPVTDESDPVGDVQLILRVSSFDTSQQAQRLANTIGAPAAPHSRLLAEYAVELLRVGKDQEVMPLAQALQFAPDGAFSEGARADLLYNLHEATPIDRDSLVHLLVSLSVRYFVIAANAPSTSMGRLTPLSSLSPAQGEILWNLVPWIAKSRAAESFLVMSVSPPILQQLKAKLLSLQSGQRLSAEGEQRIRQFMSLLESH